jgi:Fic family protein
VAPIAIALADRLDEQAILDMHTALLGDTRPAWTGHWRDEQVWIGGGPYGPHGAAFVPPHHERVPDAMRDLVAYMARNDLPPLVQASLAHARFETIHPFPDGNGRAGRALVHSVLRAKRLTRTVTVPVSAGLLVDVDAYFRALDAYRGGEPASIVEMMATASFTAVGNGRQLTADLEAIRARWDDQIEARRSSAAWRLADLLVRRPVIDSPTAQQELGLSAPAVNNGIEQLVTAGVLRQVSGKDRSRRWAADEVLVALEAFAARAGRRTSTSR